MRLEQRSLVPGAGANVAMQGVRLGQRDLRKNQESDSRDLGTSASLVMRSRGVGP